MAKYDGGVPEQSTSEDQGGESSSGSPPASAETSGPASPAQEPSAAPSVDPQASGAAYAGQYDGGTPDMPQAETGVPMATSTPKMGETESPEEYTKRLTEVDDPEKDAKERAEREELADATRTPSRADLNEQCPAETRAADAADATAEKSEIDAEASRMKRDELTGNAAGQTAGAVASKGVTAPGTVNKVVAGVREAADNDANAKADRDEATRQQEALQRCADAKQVGGLSPLDPEAAGRPSDAAPGPAAPARPDPSCTAQQTEVRQANTQVEKDDRAVATAEANAIRTAVTNGLQDGAVCGLGVGAIAKADSLATVGAVVAGCVASIKTSLQQNKAAAIDEGAARAKREVDQQALDHAKGRLAQCREP